MIPILYNSDETSFASNGLGRLRDTISCRCSEERNGIFECDFEYPVNGQNYDRILLGRTIAAKYDDSEDIQPFDIYKTSAVIDGIVTVNAHHISYRLNNIILEPYTASSASSILESRSPESSRLISSSVSISSMSSSSETVIFSAERMRRGLELRIFSSHLFD